MVVLIRGEKPDHEEERVLMRGDNVPAVGCERKGGGGKGERTYSEPRRC